ncbi:MAG: PH domain-containing protein [Verrucomicrobiae bacterium]|nr:PH domain-containing protein [Verrucomicrobiae bacterium]
MEIEFQCGACGQSMSVDASGVGLTATCPGCGGPVVVPGIPPRIDPPPATPAAVVSAPLDPDAEREILSCGPSALGYLGRAIAGLSACVLGGLFVFAIPAAGAALLAIGLWLLASIWIATATVRYRLTDQRLFVRRGLIARRIDEIELFRIKDATVTQGLLERLFGIGSVTVVSTDDTTPQLILQKIPAPSSIKESIRSHYRAARKRERVGATEFIPS